MAVPPHEPTLIDRIAEIRRYALGSYVLLVAASFGLVAWWNIQFDPTVVVGVAMVAAFAIFRTVRPPWDP